MMNKQDKDEIENLKDFRRRLINRDFVPPVYGFFRVCGEAKDFSAHITNGAYTSWCKRQDA